MIDLHIHSKYSGGTWTVKELLGHAEEMGLEAISITDHDSAKTYIEMNNFNPKDYFSGKIIVGAEFNCVFNHSRIELLGYNFDFLPIQQWLDSYYSEEMMSNNKVKEFNDMVLLCKEKGVRITEGLEYNPEKEYPTDVILKDIMKYPENKEKFDDSIWNNPEKFYRSCTSDQNFFLFRSMEKAFPSAEEISKLIRDNGGKVFLAHLFKYKMTDHLKFAQELLDAHIIDGIECYYLIFSEEQSSSLVSFCEKNNLYMSGGTDCHGDRDIKRSIGIGFGNMNVPLTLVSDWIEEYKAS